MKRATSSESNNPTKKQTVHRGRWNYKRELTLMLAYNKYHSYSQPHYNTTAAWQNIIVAVNAVKKLFSKYQKVMDLPQDERHLQATPMLKTALGRATYQAMREEDAYKDRKMLDEKRGLAKKKSDKRRGDELMHMALYGTKGSKTDSTTKTSSEQHGDTVENEDVDEDYDEDEEDEDEGSVTASNYGNDGHFDTPMNKKVLNILEMQELLLDKQELFMEKQETFNCKFALLLQQLVEKHCVYVDRTDKLP
ncbi:hypothetical protein J3Q64DRAFT_1855054 [Phycomyces blakesleeanus]|uniref:MADF domain-containing protein n=1 Tax=Phycomyces blakesleeanus TaxID=4837 RepID=A0ABR3BCG6_PHYBL